MAKKFFYNELAVKNWKTYHFTSSTSSKGNKKPDGNLGYSPH